MPVGRCTYWNIPKGFGFVRPDDNTADSFVHASALIDVKLLNVGERVTYEIVWDDRRGKEKAANVRLVP